MKTSLTRRRAEQEHPLELNDLLVHLSKKDGVLDHSRVVVLMKKRLPLIKHYLEHVQPADMKSVNEALNTIYIEEEDFAKLAVGAHAHARTWSMVGFSRTRLTMSDALFAGVGEHVHQLRPT